MIKENLKEYYEDLFDNNKTVRIEYGNSDLSLEFFKLKDIPLDARILEIGCNIGTLCYKLYQTGYKNIIGIDINSKGIEFGKVQYPELKDKLFPYDGENLPFDNESFDVVISFDVIEHIPDTKKHFEEVNRVLEVNGKYIFQTPNKYINILWIALANRSIHLEASAKEHCSLQTYSSLRRIAKEKGFKVISLSKYRILNNYNKSKVKKKLGPLGILLLNIAELMPGPISTNIWGVIMKI